MSAGELNDTDIETSRITTERLPYPTTQNIVYKTNIQHFSNRFRLEDEGHSSEENEKRARRTVKAWQP